MPHPNQQLDQLLNEADQQLQSDRLAETNYVLDGSAIRNRSNHRGQQRRNRQRVGLAATIVLLGSGLLLWSNRSTPDQVVQPQPNESNRVEDVSSEPPSNNQRLVELQRLQKKLIDIDSRLAKHRIDYQIKSTMMTLDHQIERVTLTGSLRSPESSFQRNQDVWVALELITNGRSGILADKDRMDFQILADGYPDTLAGLLAQNILATNQIPKSLYEKSHEF